jgi:predicted nuclease of predicted toxin-antitoxin system
MRFKIDENLPIEVKQVLQEAGYEATTVVDESLSGAPESDIARVCRRERRAIITLDLDFADIRHYPPEEYSGLIVLRIAQQDRNSVTSIIERLVVPLKTEILDRRLWIVDERRIRIRE